MPNISFKIEKEAAACLLGLIINHHKELESLCFSMISNELIQSKPFSITKMMETVVNTICKSRDYQGIVKNSEEQLPNVNYLEFKELSEIYKNKILEILNKLVSAKLLDVNGTDYSLPSPSTERSVNFLSSCEVKVKGLGSLLNDIKTMNISFIDYDHWLQQQNKKHNATESGSNKTEEQNFPQLQQENKQLRDEVKQLKTSAQVLTNQLGDQKLANDQLRETIKNLQDTAKDLQEKIQQSEAQSKNLMTVKNQFWNQFIVYSQENERLKDKNKRLEQELNQEKLKSSEKISQLEQELRTAKTTINALKSPPPQQQSKTQFWTSSQEFRGGSADSSSQAPLVAVWKTTKNPNTDPQWVKKTFKAITPRKRKSAENDNNNEQTDSQTSMEKTSTPKTTS